MWTFAIRKRHAVAVGCLVFSGGLLMQGAQANQREELLSLSVATALRSQIDAPYGVLPIKDKLQASEWVAQAIGLVHNMTAAERRPFLERVHYEATRAALDPWLVLALIKVESGFQRYATSVVGAQGYMQVMPFWRKTIGSTSQSLFDPATNLRYGCTILRHYLYLEHGNIARALARYNGSLGKTTYPEAIFATWKKYRPDTLQAFQP